MSAAGRRHSNNDVCEHLRTSGDDVCPCAPNTNWKPQMPQRRCCPGQQVRLRETFRWQSVPFLPRRYFALRSVRIAMMTCDDPQHPRNIHMPPQPTTVIRFLILQSPWVLMRCTDPTYPNNSQRCPHFGDKWLLTLTHGKLSVTSSTVKTSHRHRQNRNLPGTNRSISNSPDPRS
jgi:hypothetical protein